MERKVFYDPLSVDPDGYHQMFEYIMGEGMGRGSTQDQTWPNGLGPILTSPDGTEFRLTVDNNGNLSTEEV